jgi:hypothetical protein
MGKIPLHQPLSTEKRHNMVSRQRNSRTVVRQIQAGIEGFGSESKSDAFT